MSTTPSGRPTPACPPSSSTWRPSPTASTGWRLSPRPTASPWSSPNGASVGAPAAPDGQPVNGSGQVCGGDDGDFVNDMSQWIATHNVFEATFWDYGTSSVDQGSNPNTAAALRADFG